MTEEDANRDRRREKKKTKGREQRNYRKHTMNFYRRPAYITNKTNPPLERERKTQRSKGKRRRKRRKYTHTDTRVSFFVVDFFFTYLHLCFNQFFSKVSLSTHPHPRTHKHASLLCVCACMSMCVSM